MSKKFAIEPGEFEASWDSLYRYEVPSWFRDAKLGIWSHWGPQSVPMYGDWYARRMYIEGDPYYNFHRRTYGHPSEFGYKDIVKLWKAEAFDPEALMDLYVKAGAKYFCAQACHHDNFDNWDSKHNPWNAVRVGPQKNIVRLWQEAARARGLYFGVTEHLGATFNWFAVNKGCDKTGRYAGVPYDGNDPEYESLYLPNRGETRECWYTANEWWHEHWFKRILDLIDQHKPDLLYSDGPLPFNIPGKGLTRPEPGLAIVAHLYNTSIREHGENRAVYNQKDTNPDVFRIGVLDIERGGMQECPDHTWQTDTCVGGWFYNFQHKYKTPKHVIEMLIDIVSKNGNLLLNIPQRPDGSHDEECLYLLDEMAAWIAVNGEGIYGTRPWRVCEEGPTRSNESGAFKESELTWTSKDFRFTSKNGDVYAFIMQWPEDGLVFIRSLANGPNPPAGRVSLLGHNEPLEFTQNEYGLGVRLPERAPSRYMCCLKVEFES